MTEHKVAAPGWYPDGARPGEMRRWDGSGWVDEWRPVSGGRSSPGRLLGIALLIAVLAGGVAFAIFESNEAENIGTLILIVGGMVAGMTASVAVIAMGVALGLRVARERGHH